MIFEKLTKQIGNINLIKEYLITLKAFEICLNESCNGVKRTKIITKVLELVKEDGKNISLSNIITDSILNHTLHFEIDGKNK